METQLTKIKPCQFYFSHFSCIRSQIPSLVNYFSLDYCNTFIKLTSCHYSQNLQSIVKNDSHFFKCTYDYIISSSNFSAIPLYGIKKNLCEVTPECLSTSLLFLLPQFCSSKKNYFLDPIPYHTILSSHCWVLYLPPHWPCMSPQVNSYCSLKSQQWQSTLESPPCLSQRLSLLYIFLWPPTHTSIMTIIYISHFILLVP